MAARMKVYELSDMKRGKVPTPKKPSAALKKRIAAAKRKSK